VIRVCPPKVHVAGVADPASHATDRPTHASAHNMSSGRPVLTRTRHDVGAAPTYRLMQQAVSLPFAAGRVAILELNQK
jgi:hypothetical protein